MPQFAGELSLEAVGAWESKEEEDGHLRRLMMLMAAWFVVMVEAGERAKRRRKRTRKATTSYVVTKVAPVRTWVQVMRSLGTRGFYQCFRMTAACFEALFGMLEPGVLEGRGKMARGSGFCEPRFVLACLVLRLAA